MKFNENLREVMTMRGVTQNKLAKQIQVTQTAISKWCAGTREPDFETLCKICKALDTDPNELLGFAD